MPLLTGQVWWTVLCNENDLLPVYQQLSLLTVREVHLHADVDKMTQALFCFTEDDVWITVSQGQQCKYLNEMFKCWSKFSMMNLGLLRRYVIEMSLVICKQSLPWSSDVDIWWTLVNHLASNHQHSTNHETIFNWFSCVCCLFSLCSLLCR